MNRKIHSENQRQHSRVELGEINDMSTIDLTEAVVAGIITTEEYCEQLEKRKEEDPSVFEWFISPLISILISEIRRRFSKR